MTGPFVVVDCACFPIRKVCTPDPRGVLLFARTPMEAGRFDTGEEAAEAIRYTCEVRAWVAETYQVLTLAEWEDEQEAQVKRDQERAALAKQRKKKAVEESEA